MTTIASTEGRKKTKNRSLQGNYGLSFQAVENLRSNFQQNVTAVTDEWQNRRAVFLKFGLQME
ncbi:MAG: hypothetical protein ACE10O_06790, partial [Candidatus Acidiferrales bacterium]